MNHRPRGCEEGGGSSLDPIELELLRNGFLSICEEMAHALIRSSHSPNIKERRDCSCSLYTPSGEMAVQAEHIPIHLGVMPYALQGIRCLLRQCVCAPLAHDQVRLHARSPQRLEQTDPENGSCRAGNSNH